MSVTSEDSTLAAAATVSILVANRLVMSIRLELTYSPFLAREDCPGLAETPPGVCKKAARCEPV